MQYILETGTNDIKVSVRIGGNAAETLLCLRQRDLEEFLRISKLPMISLARIIGFIMQAAGHAPFDQLEARVVQCLQRSEKDARTSLP